MNKLIHISFALCAAMLGASVAFAQPAAPRRDGPARPYLLTQGSIGEIAALTFSPDSRFLYVAGADKVIRTWSLEREKGQFSPVVVQNMRWEISRGYQGQFYTIAISPNGSLIAGAGISARYSGDIGLWDTGTGRLAKPSVLPVARVDQPANGHVVTVDALDFSPNGRSLVSIDKLGAIWVWDTVTGAGSPAQVGGPNRHETRLPISFINDTHFAAPLLNNQLQLAIYSIAPGELPKPLTPPNTRITALASHRAAKLWASADLTGAIQIRDVTGNPVRSLDPTDSAASSLAFLGPDLLAAVRFSTGQTPGRLEIINWKTSQILQTIPVGKYDESRALAVSPDSRWIAYGYPNSDEVRLISLPDGNPAQLPPVTEHLKLRGRGHAIWEAHFVGGPAEHKIRYLDRESAENPDIDQKPFGVFDIDQMQLVPPNGIQNVRTGEADRGGWTAQIKPIQNGSRRETVTQLFFNGQPQGQIGTDYLAQGTAKCYCWIARPNEVQPFAIAIGTEDQDAIFIYSLPAAGRPTRLLRYFRDHVAAVTSLSVSADRTLLASSSLDQTVKFWSLEDLNLAAFPNHTAWGADFVIEQGKLIVRNVHPKGIAARRGLKNGDAIKLVSWADDDGKKTYQARVPEEMLQVLSTRDIFKEVFMEWGDPLQQRRIVPGWEPVATFFVDRHDEWVLFTPDGVFAASPTEGPKLLGWQFNSGRGFDPEVFEAGELLDLRKPDLLKQLLTQGQIPPAQLNVADATVNHPIVRIDSPKLTDPPAPPGGVTQVNVTLQYPPGSNPGEISGALYVNSQRMTDVQASPIRPSVDRPGYREQTITKKVKTPESLNSIQFTTSTSKAPEQTQRGTATFVAGKPTSSDKLRINIVAITCQNYSGDFGPLPKSKSDGDGICETFRKYAGQHYELGEIWRLDDTMTAVNRSAVQLLFSKVCSTMAKTQDRDLLLFYISGHGHVLNDGRNDVYRFIPSTPAFVSKKMTPQQQADAAVGWPDLKQICELPCRKLFLVDTCRAGDLPHTSQQMMDGARKESMLVFSATGRGESALADPTAKYSEFTSAWIRGMQGHADGYEMKHISKAFTVSGKLDDIIQLEELTSYTEKRVPEMTEGRQSPCVFEHNKAYALQFPVCNVDPSLKKSPKKNLTISGRP